MKQLSNFETFHRLVPALVKRMNEDRLLALRAMANPILAIEEMGVQLSPDVAREVELRARFSEDKRKRLASIEAKLKETTSGSFNPESAEQLEKVLFTHLRLQRPSDLQSLDMPRRYASPPRTIVFEKSIRLKTKIPKGHAGDTKKVIGRMIETPTPPDPLIKLKGIHPVVDLCIEYRSICIQTPPFASRAEYEALKAKVNTLPISKIFVHLPEHVEDNHA